MLGLLSKIVAVAGQGWAHSAAHPAASEELQLPECHLMFIGVCPVLLWSSVLVLVVIGSGAPAVVVSGPILLQVSAVQLFQIKEEHRDVCVGVLVLMPG
jgi:hypothetical protein